MTPDIVVEPSDYWSRPLVDRLRERAIAARSEGTGTAIADAGHFEEAATLIVSQADEIERLNEQLEYWPETSGSWQQRATAAEALVAEKAEEIAMLKTAIFGSDDHDPILSIGCFVEMARTAEAARKGAFARALTAEAALAKAVEDEREAALEDAAAAAAGAALRAMDSGYSREDASIAAVVAVRALKARTATTEEASDA